MIKDKADILEGSIPKDMLSKLIYAEILKGNALEHGGVYLDLTAIDEAEIKEKHVLYYNRFKNAGIDITKEKIEVAPCAHSFMGGIVIDKDCKTCIDGLYAAGEVAGGIHGANRVGGNAGTEIYVFGTVSGKSASDYAKNCDFEELSDDNEMNFADDQNVEYFENVKAKIRSVMSKYMGPVRNGDGLETALEIITNLDIELKNTKADSFDALVSKKECENMLVVCLCSVKGAIERKESRGVHFRSDYPEISDEYKKNFIHKEQI